MPSIERPPAQFAVVINPGDQPIMLAQPIVPEAAKPASTSSRPDARASREALRTELPRPGQSNLRRYAPIVTGAAGVGATLAGGTIALYGVTQIIAPLDIESANTSRMMIGVGGSLVFAGLATIMGSALAARLPREVDLQPVPARQPIEIEVVVLSPDSDDVSPTVTDASSTRAAMDRHDT